MPCHFRAACLVLVSMQLDALATDRDSDCLRNRGTTFILSRPEAMSTPKHRQVEAKLIGLLVRVLWLAIDGFHWLRWGLSHVPGKPESIFSKRSPYGPAHDTLFYAHTVDGRNPAPPKTPWNDDSPVNANEQWFATVSKWCRISSIHSMSDCAIQVLSPGQDQCYLIASYLRALQHVHAHMLGQTDVCHGCRQHLSASLFRSLSQSRPGLSQSHLVPW